MFNKKYIPQQNGFFYLYKSSKFWKPINVIYHNNKLNKKNPMIIPFDTDKAFEKHIL